MQPTTKLTKAAIYIKGTSQQKIQIEIEKLNEYLINDGCELAGLDQIFIDSNHGFDQLAKLVEQAQNAEIKVVYVSHDLLGEDREQYRALINKLYVQQAVSILICE